MQLRATWSDEASTCVLLNPESSKPNIISSLVTDVVLLLIMLMGLLRSGISKGGAFGVGRMLWNQVRWWQFLLAVILPEFSFVRVSFGSCSPRWPRSLQQYVT
jgi:hypothetical protein